LLASIYGLQKRASQWNNVIKLSSETRPEIKMEFETAWEKALCRLFFWCKQGKSVQQTKRMNDPLKKMFM
jgi:hypothetical protein